MCYRIVLINPPQRTRYPQPPLGLAMVAAVLEKEDYSVEILDFSASKLAEDSLPSSISSEKPDVIGITAMTPTVSRAIKVAKLTKKTGKRIPVVLGGHHATILAEETLQTTPEIDVIVRGEGEQTIVDLVRVLEEEGDLKGVKGISYRDGTAVKSTPARPPIQDLDSLPFPAFHLLPVNKYRLHPPFGRRSPVMSIITSRGCPYRCIFCSKSVFGNKYRCNSPSYVMEEIRFLCDELGIKEIKFYDDVFTLNRKNVFAICSEMIKQGMDIPWTCETRVNLINDDVLKVMKYAGCYMIGYGVESGNQQVLDALRKDITLDQATKALKATQQAGIETVAYFMIGSLGESPQTIRDTIEFAKRLDPDFAQFSVTTPYPGTELHRLAFKDESSPETWDDYTYASLTSIDGVGFRTRVLSRTELRELNKEAYLSFYFRWHYLWKKLRRIRHMGELKTYISGFRMLMDLIV